MILSPLDETGTPVDWWFIYKVPKLTSDGFTLAATGYEYAYYDAPSAKVVQSPNTLDRDEGALRLTLDALFAAPADTTGWILYNDEIPEGATSSSLGHTKGVIGFDLATDTAFWLLHSWPKYALPQSGPIGMPTPLYGQTFLCVALNLESARALASQMITHQQPQVYDPRLPDGLAADDPLRLLAGRIHPTDPGNALVLPLMSRGGLAMKSIAKNRAWGSDFWNDLVGPALNEDINVESWIRGPIPPTQDSDGIHQTLDIKYITLKPVGMPWAWSEAHDHAKWAISHADNWICVGDINRMISQQKRGGGTIAFQDPVLWALLNKTDLLIVPPGWTATDAIEALRSTQVAAVTRPILPTISHLDVAHVTSAGHDIAGAPTQKFASVVGIVDQTTEHPITGRSGSHLQFYIEAGPSVRCQVDVNIQSRDGSEIEVYVGHDPLQPAGTNPAQPLGTSAYGVFRSAELSYPALGLRDDEFTPTSALHILGMLDAALSQSEFVSVYGKLFNDGLASERGIHDTHFTGKANQDGAIAVYIRDPVTHTLKRTWYFFKFREDSITSPTPAGFGPKAREVRARAIVPAGVDLAAVEEAPRTAPGTPGSFPIIFAAPAGGVP
ncbi:deoxyribonuclease II family protein [Mesorhizobium australicum]|uniref:deoxyribonuclease II family protein n=1 Tax=Mesorhizobium australicum TaxID=536018 RepID=UPI00333DB2D7